MIFLLQLCCVSLKCSNIISDIQLVIKYRNITKYNIYLLEDLLRFIKKNGFDALGKLHGIGMKSCEGLYRTLRNKDILKSKDTCDLFRYIFI